ncbi:MAG: LL-diaminopimelate aminotransferase [Clostridia bacterium]|nr:LL-diaminopimelate aminotransferase [Clostridia bacterium]
MKINQNHFNLIENYLFSEVADKVKKYSEKNPDKKVIKLGIGDVTLPLCKVVVEEMKKAADEMSHKNTFKGYGPEEGYLFLREKVQDYYNKKNVTLSTDEIFINDGAKCDIGNILELFSQDNYVLIPDPVYPAYVDCNVMDGRKIKYINATKANDFLPLPARENQADIIYLCSPNNPTGAVYNHKQLQAWVDFALANEAIILFDAAYEAFIGDKNLPSSIFEVENARKCAVEFCSLSKTAGFTGIRCGYTIIPQDLIYESKNLNKMWKRRLAAKFNGVSYIVQRGAGAVFSEDGQKQIQENIQYYKNNAQIISRALDKLNIYYTGGINSPYIWMKCPDGMTSWDFFDYLLQRANVVGTPGSGFGKNGEGFFRLTAFGDRENMIEAAERIAKL